MRLVGVTGGLCSGKSTVARMLASLGAELIDADAIARGALTPRHPIAARVVEQFGREILADDGSIDRQRLADRVFADSVQLNALTELIHPYVREVMRRQVEEIRQRNPEAVVVLDVPLLYESGMDSLVDVVIVVSVPETVQVARARQQWRLPASAVRQRIAAQWPIERKRARADIVLDNSGTLAQTQQYVEEIWPELRQPVRRD